MRAVVILGAMLVIAGAGVRAQDPLGVAKDLYDSAAYEDALSALNRLDGVAAPEIVRQVDEYRAFCLFALGRTGEAESIAESLIRQDPLARLSTLDVSPRLEQMFIDVRKRMLPLLIRDRFQTARVALDQKRFAAAEPQLIEAQLMILEATSLGVSAETLADLSVLIDGFLQLGRSTENPRPFPQLASAAALLASASRPSRVPTARLPFYSTYDRGVVPPVAIQESMPALPRDRIMIAQAWKVSGVLRVMIDEAGRVVDASVNRAMDPSLETLIIDTARQWKYLPARRGGVPVRYLKTIALIK